MDENEFEDLYRRAGRRLIGVTYAACGDLQEAQDCVQEAFVRAWARRHLLDPGGAPEAFVRVTALRLAVSRWRRRVTADRALVRSGWADGLPAPDGDHVDVVRAMRSLPPKARVVVALHYLCDVPVAEIATQTGVPINTVKSHVSAGAPR